MRPRLSSLTILPYYIVGTATLLLLKPYYFVAPLPHLLLADLDHGAPGAGGVLDGGEAVRGQVVLLGPAVQGRGGTRLGHVGGGVAPRAVLGGAGGFRRVADCSDGLSKRRGELDPAVFQVRSLHSDQWRGKMRRTGQSALLSNILLEDDSAVVLPRGQEPVVDGVQERLGLVSILSGLDIRDERGVGLPDRVRVGKGDLANAVVGVADAEALRVRLDRGAGGELRCRIGAWFGFKRYKIGGWGDERRHQRRSRDFRRRREGGTDSQEAYCTWHKEGPRHMRHMY